MEAEYGTNILKLATGLRDNYRQQPDGANGQAHFKQGTYGDCWTHILEMHERLGNNRLEFSRDLQVVSEELSSIYKETDRSRKQVYLRRFSYLGRVCFTVSVSCIWCVSWSLPRSHFRVLRVFRGQFLAVGYKLSAFSEICATPRAPDPTRIDSPNFRPSVIRG